MKKARVVSSPDAGVAVTALLVCRHQHTFLSYRPLYRCVLIVVKADHLIDRPAEGAVVDDDVFVIARAESIVLA